MDETRKDEMIMILRAKIQEENLPDEDFEYEMVAKAWGVVYEKINHIKSAIKEV